MTKNDDRAKIKIDRKKEMRTKEISKMISEGGLGADKYYDITKKSSSSEKETKSPKNSKNDEDWQRKLLKILKDGTNEIPDEAL